AVVAVLGPRPRLDRGVECVLMLQPAFERRKAAVIEPVATFGGARQRPPFVIAEAGDRDPAILAGAAIGAVRRRRLIGRAVAVAAEHAVVGRPVEDRRAGQEDAALALRGVDPLA